MIDNPFPFRLQTIKYKQTKIGRSKVHIFKTHFWEYKTEIIKTNKT